MRRSLGGSPDAEEFKFDSVVRQNPMEASFREVSIRYMAGTIDTEEILRFRRLLFRASRGKVLSYFEEIGENLKDFQGKNLIKSVYVLVFEEGTHMKEKIAKICDSF